jgi:hypothetical protein
MNTKADISELMLRSSTVSFNGVRLIQGIMTAARRTNSYQRRIMIEMVHLDLCQLDRCCSTNKRTSKTIIHHSESQYSNKKNSSIPESSR